MTATEKPKPGEQTPVDASRAHGLLIGDQSNQYNTFHVPAPTRTAWIITAVSAAFLLLIGMLVIVLLIASGNQRPDSARGSDGAATPAVTSDATPSDGAATRGSPSSGRSSPASAKPTMPPLPSGPFNSADAVIISIADSTVLTSTETTNGSAVTTGTWQAVAGQRWRFNRTGYSFDESYFIVSNNSPNLRLGLEGGNPLRAALVSPGGIHDTWIYDPETQQLHSWGESYCLTTHGPGKQPTLEWCSGGADQRWRLAS